MRKNIKNTAALSIINILEKVVGLVKTLLLTFFYGASYISDVYNIVVYIPDTLYAFLGNGINASYIPVASELKEEDNNYFTSDLVTLLTIVSLLICSFLTFFPDVLISIFAPGFDEKARILAETLIRISIWSFCFMIINHVFSSFLHLKRRFIGSASAALLMGTGQCFAIYLSVKTSNLVLAYGILIGSAIQSIIVISLSINAGFRFSLSKEQIGVVKRILLLSVPVLISTSASRVNVIIDKAIASYFSAGGISSLSYADVLVLFVRSVIAVPIVTVLFPEISKKVADREKGVEGIVSKCMIYLAIFLIPITFGTFALSESIIKIVYGRGSFSDEAIYLTSQCLQLYVLRLYFTCVRDLLVKVHYANKDTKSPTINVVIGIVLNICLNFILSRLFGVQGLALATSISSAVIFAILLVSAKKYIDIKKLQDCFKKTLKIITASFVMFIVVIIIKSINFTTNVYIHTFIGVVSGVTIYTALIALLKVITINEIKSMLKRSR